ncbi:MAG: hypothetical protein J1E96_04950 [Ruminococcus sp.]|nr:hypothetical protein [Ruminococcus sp.]
MKKNKMMRAALALLVVTMLTMSIVSGTFAKYVTQGSASDSARVAKFGVVVEGSSELFAKNYLETTNTPGEDTATLSVKSSGTAADDYVVAPGTQSKAEAMKLSVKGTPEVAVNVNFAVTAAKDIVLKKSNGLPDKTVAGNTTFDNAADYYPVKFTLKKGTETLVTDDTLAAVEAALKDSTLSKKYAAGTALDTAIGDLVLTWKWDFETNNDKQDTLLGDLAANAATVDSGLYNLDTEFAVTVSVTQVD